MKYQELQQLNKERDDLKDREGERLTKEKQKIHEMKQEAADEYDNLRKMIEGDDEDRKRREEDERLKQEAEEAKVQEKLATCWFWYFAILQLCLILTETSLSVVWAQTWGSSLKSL